MEIEKTVFIEEKGKGWLVSTVVTTPNKDQEEDRVPSHPFLSLYSPREGNRDKKIRKEYVFTDIVEMMIFIGAFMGNEMMNLEKVVSV